MEPQVVGRDEQLVQLDHFVELLASGPGRLVIEGEAGIGKTTVWQATVDAAAQRGYRLLTSRPAQSEAGMAYSVLADLLADVDQACLDTLPEPQRNALEIALLVTDAAGRPPEPRAIFTAFGGVLRMLGGEAPVVVGVDDLQWADSSSVRALHFISRRLVDERVGILTTRRLEGEPSEQFHASGATVLRLGPLSPGALYQLIKARVGLSLTRPALLRLHRTTGGNPFFAVELAETLVAAELPGATDPWPVPDDLRDIVTARVALLSQPVRAVLLTAAASARPTIAGVDASAMREAEEAGIITVGQHGRVHFAHPLFASAIYESATSDELRRVHSRLAEETADIEERARHSALASGGPDNGVAVLLDQAAAKARARGAPDVAAELEERSGALTPLDRPDEAWQRRATAAEHHFHAGDLERTRGLLLELVDGRKTGRAQSSALRLLGETCYRLGYLHDALRYLRQAVDAAEGDAGSIARAEMAFATALFYSFGSFEEANAAAQRALVEAEGLGNNALLAEALALSVLSEHLIGHGIDDQKLGRALALEDPEESGPIETKPSMHAGMALVHAEQFERARSVLGSLCERLVEHGEDSDLPDALAYLAELECFAGNLAEAGRLADRGFELAHQAGSQSHMSTTRAMRALVHAHAGETAEARSAAAEAIELADRSGWRWAAFWATTALGLLELSLGNDAAVVETLAYSIGLVEERGVIEPSRRPFLADATEALVRLGELDRAELLTEQLEGCGRAFERSSAIVAGARCRALVLAARGDVKGALEALERGLAEEPRLVIPLELARTLIVKGQLQRRRKQRRAARDSLQRALEICEAIGAALWAERACSELARLGRVPDPDDLTATEARVAELAAAGMTNREIAATAFITPKTVEANLSRIYRKLGIRSRAELGVRLAERTSPR